MLTEIVLDVVRGCGWSVGGKISCNIGTKVLPNYLITVSRHPRQPMDDVQLRLAVDEEKCLAHVYEMSNMPWEQKGFRHTRIDLSCPGSIEQLEQLLADAAKSGRTFRDPVSYVPVSLSFQAVP